MNNDKCVYTVLIGNYEKLNEQEVRHDSSIDFVCFTDDKNLISKTWKIVNIDPIFPLDNIRSARAIKITPHRYLPQYKTSLYIDNSVTLKVIPEEIFNDFISDDYNLYCIKHSFRETVLDEFEEVLRINYDKPNTIMEQLNAYSIIDPDVFKQKPYWSGFLVRNHNQVSIKNMMEDWLAQIMRYSRRDQLSLNYTIRKHNIVVKDFDLDNSDSKYHKWPTSIRYGEPAYKLSLLTSVENNIRAKTLETELKNLSENIEELEMWLMERDNNIQNLNTIPSLTNVSKLFKTSIPSLTNVSKLFKTSIPSLTNVSKLAKTSIPSLTNVSKLSKTSIPSLTNVSKKFYFMPSAKAGG
ncbi:MAG: glycosyltransferase domain-containing protein [Candidatus Helarchaeota archaeon]